MTQGIDIVSDSRFKEYVINRLTPFPTILGYAGFKGYSYEGKCFCPFHSNTDTPASKLYHDASGDTLWCFSEQKRYKPSDVITRNLMPKVTVDSVFSGIWKQLSDDDKVTLVEDYGKPVSYLPENWEENKEILKPFRSGDITFVQYLVLLKTILTVRI